MYQWHPFFCQSSKGTETFLWNIPQPFVLSGLIWQPLASWLLPRWGGQSLGPLHWMQNNSDVSVAELGQEEIITHCFLSFFHTVLPNIAGEPSSCVYLTRCSLPSDVVIWGTTHHSFFLVSSVLWGRWEMVGHLLSLLLLCFELRYTVSGPHHYQVSWSVLTRGTALFFWTPCIFKCNRPLGWVSQLFYLCVTALPLSFLSSRSCTLPFVK